MRWLWRTSRRVSVAAAEGDTVREAPVTKTVTAPVGEPVEAVLGAARAA